MPSVVAKALQRVQGIEWGDTVRDSAVYIDGHTVVVEVIGSGIADDALVVRGLGPTNAPTELFAVDKTGLLTAAGGLDATGGQSVPSGLSNATVYLRAGDGSIEPQPPSGSGWPAKITAGFYRTQADDFIGYGVQNWLTHNGNISASGIDNRIATSSGTRDHIAGMQSVSNAAGGTLTHVYGVLVNDLLTGGTITNHYAFYAETPTTGATITNNYGVYVKDQRSVGTTINYALYTGGGDIDLNNGRITSALTHSPAANANGILAAIGGTIAEAGSGTHSVMVTMQVSAPTITNGSAASTNGAALYIPNSGSGATNNYSLMIGGGTAFMGGDVQMEAALDHNGTTVGFFGTAPTTKQTVSGAKGGNAALGSLLTALAAYGFITDSTSA